MNQSERRIYLIDRLLMEKPEYSRINVPGTAMEQRRLLRSLMNVREAAPADREFMAVQDSYLRGRAVEKGITDIRDLEPVMQDVYLWQGDITTLRCGAIVNAANSGMTGCYVPCHGCIDNVIGTFAGIGLRAECQAYMDGQREKYGPDYEEPTGSAVITGAYDLPSDYVIHTVGPIVNGRLQQEHCSLLASCYRSCLDLAVSKGISSIAFCCISTGVFGFPKQEAAKIAVRTVLNWLKDNENRIKVIFNVFTDEDLAIYKKILSVE